MENLVLNGFNVHLVEGENLVIMGKSGSGKIGIDQMLDWTRRSRLKVARSIMDKDIA